VINKVKRERYATIGMTICALERLGVPWMLCFNGTDYVSWIVIGDVVNCFASSDTPLGALRKSLRRYHENDISPPKLRHSGGASRDGGPDETTETSLA